jgi:hypothetical protein
MGYLRFQIRPGVGGQRGADASDAGPDPLFFVERQDDDGELHKVPKNFADVLRQIIRLQHARLDQSAA